MSDSYEENQRAESDRHGHSLVMHYRCVAAVAPVRGTVSHELGLLLIAFYGSCNRLLHRFRTYAVHPDTSVPQEQYICYVFEKFSPSKTQRTTSSLSRSLAPANLEYIVVCLHDVRPVFVLGLHYESRITYRSTEQRKQETSRAWPPVVLLPVQPSLH